LIQPALIQLYFLQQVLAQIPTQQLALEMGARYVPLPLANGSRMAQAILTVQSGGTLSAIPAAPKPVWQTQNAPSTPPVWRNPA
jgi:hypothetical protein